MAAVVNQEPMVEMKAWKVSRGTADGGDVGWQRIVTTSQQSTGGYSCSMGEEV